VGLHVGVDEARRKPLFCLFPPREIFVEIARSNSSTGFVSRRSTVQQLRNVDRKIDETSANNKSRKRLR